VPQGTTKKGEHHNAYIACGRFDRATRFAFVSTTNPWGEHTPGRMLHREVLLRLTEGGTKEVTVGEILDAALALKQSQFSFTARETQDHLRWLYTFAAYCTMDGGMWPAQPGNTIPVKKRAPRVAAPAPVTA
jgi:hypothetical protein